MPKKRKPAQLVQVTSGGAEYVREAIAQQAKELGRSFNSELLTLIGEKITERKFRQLIEATAEAAAITAVKTLFEKRMLVPVTMSSTGIEDTKP